MTATTQGRNAYTSGKSEHANPYDRETFDFWDWRRGWTAENVKAAERSRRDVADRLRVAHGKKD